MQTFKYDFEFKQGASLDKTFTYKAGPNQTPVDLTGCAAWMVVRLKDKNTTEVLRLTTTTGVLTIETGGITLGGAAGTVRVQITRDQSKKFVWDNVTYTLHVQYPSAFVQRLMEGDPTVSHCND